MIWKRTDEPVEVYNIMALLLHYIAGVLLDMLWFRTTEMMYYSMHMLAFSLRIHPLRSFVYASLLASALNLRPTPFWRI